MTSRDVHHGGVYFSKEIPWQVRGDLYDVIAGLEDWSVVWQFAFARYSPPYPATGTEVYVTKMWHQENEPHLTVKLGYVCSDS
ncbi:uncharacterized protein K460DRAFT_402171 [Cucurbitaria berberidis CBS 394.84]|uniref:Uncharacterized protein n=1 Tax=Cucurbitaria berberidis CBS 394.84 TaxID=1168544 RepID=A0A9P4GUR0_9PLEO|nr:uncharacterized protein K460DRAFT_402171 [Cucurbitaria berberidis CBS 394.84]KAF1852182.1 hypothetical protein K460DRAFT_402171 [Cucurbitaria berberidis CBS 394.84]